jgi:hypothetical protein
MIKLIPIHAAALTVLLASPLAAQTVIPKPFKAVVRTQESLVLNPEACATSPFLQGNTAGTGTATSMGKITAASADCIVPGEGTYTFTGGRLVLTGADGDTLTAEYSGFLTPTAKYPVFSLSGSYRIVGGTGRFTGATGSGSLQGTNNIATGAGAYTAAGVVAY